MLRPNRQHPGRRGPEIGPSLPSKSIKKEERPQQKQINSNTYGQTNRWHKSWNKDYQAANKLRNNKIVNKNYRFVTGEKIMETSSAMPQKAVYSIIERENDHNIWIRVGAGWINRDGSINIRLDALPLGNRLQIRDADETKQ
jgi:hypothetical protein